MQSNKVFTMTSVTLDETGVAKKINESGKYLAISTKLFAMDRNPQDREMAKLGAAPDWVIASVHTVIGDCHLLIALNTGSQLSAQDYAGEKVIFVVGTQKIVKDTQEGLKEFISTPCRWRMNGPKKAYDMRSNVSKILIINKEIMPERISVILVKQKLGF